MTLKQELLKLSVIVFDIDHALTSLEAEAKKPNAFELYQETIQRGKTNGK